MYEYICFTDKGKWNFQAYNDKDALRLALFYCWRDDEEFDRIEFRKGGENYTLRIFHIDNNNHYSFTL